MVFGLGYLLNKYLIGFILLLRQGRRERIEETQEKNVCIPVR
jgi:hypothetical protein